ncbi:SURF1 family protein [Microbacterium panaciterrae]|uniref:SURF1-like protein n=1 Tax=Microbacterium panaciterrae TaxID=985759 RepID=A0ABP8PH85_9MICO
MKAVPPAPSPDLLDFPPTLREVMLRGRWIGMLVLCLVVAGVFAWLGQWQLGRAIDSNPPPPDLTESVKPLDQVVKPGAYLDAPLIGQRTEASGSWVSDDFLIVSSRFNDGVEGYWVTGQLRIAGSTQPTSLAVAIGWAPDESAAKAAVQRLQKTADGSAVDLTGRLISDEGAVAPPHDQPRRMDRMSPAALLGFWHDTDELSVYRPYLAAQKPLGGLAAISSPAPVQQSPINWLNIFYAVEWAVFAGFAFYLWYRLAKDAWEREVEEFEERPGPGNPGPEPGKA